eukprot:2899422-Rhodomonas_salina.1
MRLIRADIDEVEPGTTSVTVRNVNGGPLQMDNRYLFWVQVRNLNCNGNAPFCSYKATEVVGSNVAAVTAYIQVRLKALIYQTETVGILKPMKTTAPWQHM